MSKKKGKVIGDGNKKETIKDLPIVKGAWSIEYRIITK